LDSAEREVKLSSALKQRDLALELVRSPLVVLIEQRDQIAARSVNPAIASGGDARVWLAEDAHAGPVELRQVRARAIQHDDRLARLVALRRDALKRGPQEWRAAVDWYDN